MRRRPSEPEPSCTRGSRRGSSACPAHVCWSSRRSSGTTSSRRTATSRSSDPSTSTPRLWRRARPGGSEPPGDEPLPAETCRRPRTSCRERRPCSRRGIARGRATIEAMRGNFDLAHELVRAGKAAAKEFGLEGHYSACLTAAGYIALLEANFEDAEREFEEAVELFRRMGDVGHLSSYAPALAEALCAQGRYDEALPLTEEAERVSIADDMDAQVHWRRVRATILARRGQIEEAVRLATEAADLARRTDDLDKRGRALMDLAEVLKLAGRMQESGTAAREAVETFERKGNVVMTRAARLKLGGLASST